MWPEAIGPMENHYVVVVIASGGQFLAGIREAVEDLLIQAFIAQAAVEASIRPFCCGLPGSI